MKSRPSPSRGIARTAWALGLCAAGMAAAQTFPTAANLAPEMGMGWNNGNNLEVPKDPTAWGNQLPTQALIDSVKAAGFKTVRLPCAWDSHADATTHVINANWLATVKSIVDMCIKDSLFVVLNSHWDGGWLEEHIQAADTAAVKVKQKAYWGQIANTFKSYDRHLLFASANEPAVQDPYGTAFGADRIAALNAYHQAFLDTVRATGGNNAQRILVIQTPHTDIELTSKIYNVLPKDPVSNRLMVEVHFYPYQFALMDADADWGKQFFYWGKNNHSTTDLAHNPTWGEESYVDSVFGLMKSQFVDKGMPVIVGEFGAIKRLSLPGDTLKRHIQSRRSFYEHVAKSAKARGMIPIAWDAGFMGNGTMTIFDRTANGTMYDLGLMNALRSGWGLAKLPGDTSLVKTASFSSAFKALYTAKDSGFGQVEFGVAKPDWTGYDSVKLRMYVNGTSNYDSAGRTKYGFVSMNLVTMSNNWTWREAPLGTLAMDAWKVYGVRIANDTTGGALAPALRSKVDFFALQAYSHGYHGTIYVDWLAFRRTNGTWDTLHTFDLDAPSKFAGNVLSVKTIPVDQVAADLEWTTATSGPVKTTAVGPRTATTGLRVFGSGDRIAAVWTADVAAPASVALKSLDGRTLWSGTFTGAAGANRVEMPRAEGLSVLQISQGDLHLNSLVQGR